VAAPTSGSESRRRASVVRRAGRFPGLSKGEASGAVGSGRDGADCGGAFRVKIVAIVPPRGYPQPLESQPRPEGAPSWERAAKREAPPRHAPLASASGGTGNKSISDGSYLCGEGAVPVTCGKWTGGSRSPRRRSIHEDCFRRVAGFRAGGLHWLQ
jgi:hypothetical protein